MHHGLKTDEYFKQNLAAQKVALDKCKLPGIYLVVKIKIAGAMKKIVNFIADFLRTKNI